MSPITIFIIFSILNILMIVMPLALGHVNKENRFLYFMAIVLMVIGLVGTVLETQYYGWNYTPQSNQEGMFDVFFAIVWLSGSSILTQITRNYQKQKK